MVRVVISPYLNTPQLLNVDNKLKVHPLVKNLFQVKVGQGSTGRKTNILSRKLGKINSRCEYFVHCPGFQNSFLPNHISVWFSPISKGEPKGKVTNKFSKTPAFKSQRQSMISCLTKNYYIHQFQHAKNQLNSLIHS